MTMDNFLHMGGYARYVWPAYGLWLAVVLFNIWSARRALRSARQQALRRLAIRGDER
jgi:heme exporter protein CcmD